MNLYTEQQMRDAIKMARNGARSEDNIIDSLNFIKQHSEVTMSNKKISIKILFEHFENIVEILPTIYWHKQSFREKFGRGVIVIGWLKWGFVIYISKKR